MMLPRGWDCKIAWWQRVEVRSGRSRRRLSLVFIAVWCTIGFVGLTLSGGSYAAQDKGRWFERKEFYGLDCIAQK